MLGTLITSKTRIKLLLKFFLNANNTGYLKNLEQEFEDSSNGIRLELNKFEEAGLLISEIVGNKKVFKANIKHPLFNDIHNIILKYTGIDQIIESVVEKLGDVSKVYLSGTFARGLESNVIDLIIIGDIKIDYLESLIKKVEPIVKRQIIYQVYSDKQYNDNKNEIINIKSLLIWNAGSS